MIERLVVFFAYMLLPIACSQAESWDGKIVQFGKMRDAIGKKTARMQSACC